MTGTDEVLRDVAAAVGRLLGPRLLGLYVHGSLVAGDFAPGRSDLDVFAVLSADPDDALLRELVALHAGLDRRHPRWAGRIEVEYVSRDALRAGSPDHVTAATSADERPGHVSAAASARELPGHATPGTSARELPGHATAGTSPNRPADEPPEHVMARTSPGEPIRLMPVTSHRAVTWASVREYGRALRGPAAGTLLPPVAPALVRAALLDHVRDWPVWVLGMTAPGAQAYSVLTVCRAEQRLRYGRQVSKLRAADATVAVRPDAAALVGWARDWWYGGGADTDPGRFGEVRSFVTELSAELLAAESGGG